MLHAESCTKLPGERRLKGVSPESEGRYEDGEMPEYQEKR